MRSRVVPSVLWREGMFLSTQHFQAFSRELAARVASAERLAGAAPYGLMHLTVDDDALARDVLDVRALDVVFPDGTIARVPGNAEISATGFAEHLSGPELQVWVALPEVRENRPQVDDGRDGRAHRYSVATRTAYDENLSDAAQDIEVRVLALRLFFGAEPPPGFDAVPIARIVREGRPVAVSRLSPEYVPPLIACAGSPALMRRMRELAETARGRARDLAAKVPSLARLADVERGVDFASLLLLQSINRTAAALEQLSRAPDATPFTAYLELARCCGDMALFGPERAAPALPAFEHARSDECFRGVLRELGALLGAQVEQPYDFVPLDRDPAADYFHGASLPAEWFERRAVPYLAVQLGRPPEQAARLVPDGVKLMAPSERQRVMDSVVPGIAIRHERHPPLAFPRRDDLHYFRIETDGDSHGSWRLVEQEKAALVLNPLDELAEARFELYVEKPRRP
jgi:type VI secretion system protein ImpJ